MPTTTIRLEEKLKSRLALAAERSGKSAHAFILDAIEGQVRQVEQDDELQRVAAARWSALAAGGPSVAWEDTKTYLRARASGAPARKPMARKPGR